MAKKCAWCNSGDHQQAGLSDTDCLVCGGSTGPDGEQVRPPTGQVVAGD